MFCLEIPQKIDYYRCVKDHLCGKAIGLKSDDFFDEFENEEEEEEAIPQCQVGQTCCPEQRIKPVCEGEFQCIHQDACEADTEADIKRDISCEGGILLLFSV